MAVVASVLRLLGVGVIGVRGGRGVLLVEGEGLLQLLPLLGEAPGDELPRAAVLSVWCVGAEGDGLRYIYT